MPVPFGYLRNPGRLLRRPGLHASDQSIVRRAGENRRRSRVRLDPVRASMLVLRCERQRLLVSVRGSRRTSPGAARIFATTSEIDGRSRSGDRRPSQDAQKCFCALVLARVDGELDGEADRVAARRGRSGRRRRRMRGGRIAAVTGVGPLRDVS